jgi:hypothetical protein
MSSNVRRWATGVGLAGGSAVAAAMIGMVAAPAAYADDADIFPVGTPLGQAGEILTVDNSVLGDATVPAQFEPFLEEQTQILDNAEGALNSAEALQGPTGAAYPLFTGADEWFRSATVAFESATNAFASDPTAATQSDLLFPDLQIIGASSDLAFVDNLAPLFGLGDINAAGTATELAASAASTAGIDPADLLSEATADLTEANTVLSGVDLSGQSSDIASLVSTSTQLIGSQEQLQDAIVNIQNLIVDTQMQGSSMPGYDLVTEATNALFTNADQDLLNADAALLASDQILAQSISSGAGLTDLDTLQGAAAMLGALGADFSSLATSFDAVYTPFLELFAAF